MPKTILQKPQQPKRGHLPDPPVEWLGVPLAMRTFNLGKTSIYALIKRPEIKSILLKRKGAARGKRMIEAESLRRFFAAQGGN
jgi:hypothetical protein